MKYKICKFQDDNGKEWYQIKIKWLIFWYNYEKITFSNYDYCFWQFVGDRFDSKEDAQQKINQLIMENKSKKIKLLECVEV